MKATTTYKRGSLTVEAALVVPIVIIAVLVMLYVMLIMFQACIMQLTANSIAETAAEQAVSPNKSIYSEVISKNQIIHEGLYRRWSQGIRQQELEAEARNILKANSILESEDTRIEIKSSNHIITQGVIVRLDCKYKNPLSTLTAIWGLKKEIGITVCAKATVDDPVEFTRNCDFIIDTASKIPAISEFQNKWLDIVNRIIDYINKYTKEK